MNRIPRSRRHELMLLWCRLPTGMRLVREIGKRAGATVSRVRDRVGLPKPAATTTEPVTWESSLVAQLRDANVTTVLIFGDDDATGVVLTGLRSAGCAAELRRHTGGAAALHELHMPTSEGRDCIIVRDAALLADADVDAVSTARVLVVCEAASFHGYRLVSAVLSGSQFELTGSTEEAWGGCVVLQRMGDVPARGAWEVLDLLHRTGPTADAS